MKQFLYIFTTTVLLAGANALPTDAAVNTNILSDASFESFPEKDLNKQNVFGPKGQGVAGWIVTGEVVVLSNAESPSAPTPYGKQFVRFQNYTGQNREGGYIEQRIDLPANGNYTTTFQYRILQAPQAPCTFSSFYSYRHGKHGFGIEMGAFNFDLRSPKLGTWRKATFHSVEALSTGKGETVDYAVYCGTNPGAYMLDIDQLSFFASD